MQGFLKFICVGVLNMLNKEEINKIILENKNILKKYSVKTIDLFGSYVRNEQREDSDIDFFVDFEKPTFNNYMDLIFSLENLFKKKISIITPGSLSPYLKPYIEKEKIRIET